MRIWHFCKTGVMAILLLFLAITFQKSDISSDAVCPAPSMAGLPCAPGMASRLSDQSHVRLQRSLEGRCVGGSLSFLGPFVFFVVVGWTMSSYRTLGVPGSEGFPGAFLG